MKRLMFASLVTLVFVGATARVAIAQPVPQRPTLPLVEMKQGVLTIRLPSLETLPPLPELPKGIEDLPAPLPVPFAAPFAMPFDVPFAMPQGVHVQQQSQSSSISRVNDQFTASQSGCRSRPAITVRGRVEAGVATASRIELTEQGKTRCFASVEQVPEEHRGAVQRLVGQVTRGQPAFTPPVFDLPPLVPEIR
jgi:hypothetical protein